MKIETMFKFILKLFKKKQPIDIKFGWIKDKEDPRDFKFKITQPHELPTSVDLRTIVGIQ